MGILSLKNIISARDFEKIDGKRVKEGSQTNVNVWLTFENFINIRADMASSLSKNNAACLYLQCCTSSLLIYQIMNKMHKMNITQSLNLLERCIFFVILSYLSTFSLGTEPKPLKQVKEEEPPVPSPRTPPKVTPRRPPPGAMASPLLLPGLGGNFKLKVKITTMMCRMVLYLMHVCCSLL